MLPALGLALLLLGSAAAGAAEPDGATLYRRHCAGCHGPDGRGDGPDARYLSETPRDLRDGVLRRYDVPALVHRVREGRPLAVTRDRAVLESWIRDTEALEQHLERLARTDPWLVIEGEGLWAARCERCHGRFGTPSPEAPEDAPDELPDDLADPAVQRRFDDEALREAVRHGVPGMPALEPPLRTGEVRTLAVYVRLMSPGLALYTRVCAGCHGSDGRPVDLPPGLRKPTATFDAAWLAGTTAQERETAVWHMLGTERPEMPHLGADLDAAQTAAIVRWMQETFADPDAKR